MQNLVRYLSKTITILSDQQSRSHLNLMTCKRISPEKRLWNQKVACPEGLCTKHTPHSLYKHKLFSQVLGNRQFGHQAHQLCGHQLGCLASWVAPRKLPLMEPANAGHHSPPSRQIWELRSHPGLLHTAEGAGQRQSRLPEAMGNLQWATARRSEK